jgi:hypothetical protein
MPRRMRRAKLRIGEEAERKAWRMVFTCGHDYLRDLERAGVEINVAGARGADCTVKERDEFETAARAAWKRFGVEFMQWWDSDPRHRDPWAFEQFGEPNVPKPRAGHRDD